MRLQANDSVTAGVRLGGLFILLLLFLTYCSFVFSGIYNLGSGFGNCQKKDVPYDGMTVFAGLETVRSFLGMRDPDTRK